MFKKALALIMIVTGAGMVGLLSPSPVDADEHSAIRSFSATTVDAGDEIQVTITHEDLGGFGHFEETLPAGFTYVSSSLSDASVEQEGQVVTFFVLGDDPFDYTVTASDTVGLYVFRGTVSDSRADSRDIGGPSDVTVEAGAVTPSPSPSPTQPPATEGLRATRTLPDDPVDAGSEFEVTIEPADFADGFGQVVETLPAGFSYVSSSLSDASVEQEGQVVTFFVFGDDPFTYTVTASDTAGSYTFSGIVKDSGPAQPTVAGDSGVTVEAGAGASANRSFSASTVKPGEKVVVTIEPADFAEGFGQVVETLPAGFSYESSSLSDASVEQEGQVVTFFVFGDDPFTYTVTASSVEDDHTFSGTVTDSTNRIADVDGPDTVTVAVVTPTPVTPTASPTAAPSPTTGISVTTARVRTLTAGGSSTRVNLPSIFSDMETDGLTYTAVSSRTSVVRARVSGIILRLTPGGAGTARITVTATDDDGNKERRTFTVRVRAAELPPVGDLTAPDWLLALLALAGAALVPAGVLTLRSRRRRAVP